MSDINKPPPKSNFNAENFLNSLRSDLYRPINNGIAFSELFLLEIPHSEDKQREYQENISRQFKEMSRLLEEYLQMLKDAPRESK
ncbi:hypothetical protein MNBD_CHLOROFLEXI01-4475 [hydrothermal vent metagenome]|uniref:Uncharacterized protein n=1 Tax=hydrothermal vent metagenome TaxID=652676 RepID=A0A3B0UTV9_9ZZZZ